MKKFSFRFEQVLTLRKMAEDMSLRALSAAQKKHQDEVELKEFYEAELLKAGNRRTEFSQGIVELVQLSSEQDYIEGTKQRIVVTQRAIDRAYRFVEKAGQQYQARRRQRKAIELLREKELKAFKIQVSKKEAREQEDQVLMRFGSQRESSL